MSEGRSLSLRQWLILVLTSLALFLPGFATLPPVDRDEGRYIVTSQRMADTGDVVDLRFQDEPRYLQPAGIYWLQALSVRALDPPAYDSVWAYRVPSLLGALAAVLLTGLIGARLFGARTGLIAGLLLAACASLNFEARIAKTDAMLLASIVTAQFALLRLYLEPDAKRWLAAVFWAALGVGLMIKGPIILIIVATTIAALVLWDRKAAWLGRLRPLWGPLLMLAIALPWYVAIGIVSDGEFYNRAIGQSMVDKIGNSQQGHKGPFGYHLALFALMFWPGSLLIGQAVHTAWRRRGEPAVRFLICWAAPMWIVFEFVATKLPHYVLPAYPALACLCALALGDEHKIGRIGRIGIVLWSLIWVAATAAVVAIGPLAFQEFEDGIPTFALVLSALTAIAAIAALYFVWRRDSAKLVIALAATALFGIGNIFGYTAPGLHSFWMSPRIDALVREARPCQNSNLVTTPYSEPSLVFLYGRTRTLLAGSGAEAAAKLAAGGGCDVALISAERRDDFLASAAARGLEVQARGTVSGRNYSNGDDLVLTLYSAEQRDNERN
jgi:4-amino-4-deoxy-L-arabinose transferase-like glycosyltransferase